MKGPAKLTLTREDVLDAMQEWIDKRWGSNPPVVKDLSTAMGTFSGTSEVYLHLEGNRLFVTGKP